MQIKNINQANFKANVVSNTAVKKKILGNFYSNKPVSLIQFDLNSLKDKSLLYALEKKWFLEDEGGMEEYIREFSNNFLGNVLHIFGITKQNKNIEELKINDILCIAAISENIQPRYSNNINLEFITTKPDFINDNKILRPRFKHCGQTLLNELKKLYNNKRITLIAVNNSEDFYKKNGFKYLIPNFNAMFWEKEA